jgi:hypothetical protein
VRPNRYGALFEFTAYVGVIANWYINNIVAGLRYPSALVNRAVRAQKTEPTPSPKGILIDSAIVKVFANAFTIAKPVSAFVYMM